MALKKGKNTHKQTEQIFSNLKFVDLIFVYDLEEINVMQPQNFGSKRLTELYLENALHSFFCFIF